MKIIVFAIWLIIVAAANHFLDLKGYETYVETPEQYLLAALVLSWLTVK